MNNDETVKKLQKIVEKLSAKGDREIIRHSLSAASAYVVSVALIQDLLDELLSEKKCACACHKEEDEDDWQRHLVNLF